MSGQSLALLVPAYNAATHLPRLLGSATAQTVQFDEILVYDDASSDDTAAVAERLGARVVRGEANRGCSHGKNVLAEHTSCEWVHFHDADDALLPHFVVTARRWMGEDGPDVVLFGYEERDPATDRLLAIRRFDAADLRKDPISFAIRVQINPFLGLYRRQRFAAAGGYDEEPAVLYNEDVAMHCRLALAGLTFAADPEVTVINYIQQVSMSASNRAKCIRAHYHVMRKMAEAAGGRYAEEIADRLWITAAGAASYLDWPTADEAAALAVRLAGACPTRSGALFRALCRIHVPAALRIREALIRIAKPHLRRSQPRGSARFAPGDDS